MNSPEKIIADLYNHHKTSKDRMNNIEKQVEDLQAAQKAIHERNKSVIGFEATGKEEDLDYYVEKTGLRLTASKSKIQTPQGARTIQKKGLLDDDKVSCTWQRDLQRMVGERAVVRMAQSEPYTPKMDIKIHEHMNKAPRNLQPAVSKVFNDSTNEGAEWIPDDYKPDLFRLFELPTGLRSMLNQVDVSSNSVKIPRLERGGRPYLKGKLTVDDPLAQYTATTVRTNQASITLKGFAALMNIDDSSEDSIVPVLPTLANVIVNSLEQAYEDCMINGDTTATHGDAIATWDPRGTWGAGAGLGGASDHRRGFMGWRHYALDIGADAVDNTFSAQMTYAEFLDVRYKLTELGVSKNLIAVFSPEAYLKHLMNMTELKTVDQYGANASIVTGEVSKIGGVSVVLSRFLTHDLHSSGVYTGSGSTTGFLIVNRDSWNNYMRREILLEQDKQIASGAIQLCATMRAAMATPAASSTVSVAYGYNLS